MCDWPVWDVYGPVNSLRPCGNAGHHTIGNNSLTVSICGTHFESIVDGVIAEMKAEAEYMAQAGRSNAAGIEAQMRIALRDINESRRTPEPVQMETEEVLVSSYVYFAQRDGLVKIGTSTKVLKRLREIAAGSSLAPGMTVGPVKLLAAIPGTNRNEKYFHHRFSHLRVHPKREWFHLEPPLSDFISGLKTVIEPLEVSA